MKVNKKKIADLTLCYCVAPLIYHGKRHFLVASEKEHPCLLFTESGEYVDKIWDGPGGTMSAVQIPGVDGAFLATHRFYSPNNCKEAEIVACWHENDRWNVRTLASLPGVHRFDILSGPDGDYLIACTIKSDYETKDDWRFPGKVYACRLPRDLLHLDGDYRLPLEVLKDGMLKNHGYSRYGGSGIVTAENGVFRFTPPEKEGAPWTVETLLTEAVSDALLLDLNGDGADEMVTLSPFHGDTLRVYEQKNGRFLTAFEYEKKIEFAHAICPLARQGKPAAVIGHRRGDRDLLLLTHDGSGYCVETLDHDIGPTNALSAEVDGKTVILSANREINEIAYYTLEEA